MYGILAWFVYVLEVTRLVYILEVTRFVYFSEVARFVYNLPRRSIRRGLRYWPGSFMPEILAWFVYNFILPYGGSNPAKSVRTDMIIEKKYANKPSKPQRGDMIRLISRKWPGSFSGWEVARFVYEGLYARKWLGSFSGSESSSVGLDLDFARWKYINRKVTLSSSQSIAKKPLRNFALNFAKLCGKIYQTKEMIWMV